MSIDIILGSGDKVVSNRRNKNEGGVEIWISQLDSPAEVGDLVSSKDLDPIVKIITSNSDSLDVIIEACERSKKILKNENPKTWVKVTIDE